MFWSSQTGRGEVRDSKFQPLFLHARDAWVLALCLCLRTHGCPCPHPVVLASEAGILIGRKGAAAGDQKETLLSNVQRTRGECEG